MGEGFMGVARDLEASGLHGWKTVSGIAIPANRERSGNREDYDSVSSILCRRLAIAWRTWMNLDADGPSQLNSLRPHADTVWSMRAPNRLARRRRMGNQRKGAFRLRLSVVACHGQRQHANCPRLAQQTHGNENGVVQTE